MCVSSEFPKKKSDIPEIAHHKPSSEKQVAIVAIPWDPNPLLPLCDPLHEILLTFEMFLGH